MAVFRAAEQAVQAALQAQLDLGGIEVNGHTPGASRRRPPGASRRVGGDYLGVDVNIAARVGQAARGGEVLVSEAAREVLDPEAFKFGRKRRLSATGAPRDLAVAASASARRGYSGILSGEAVPPAARRARRMGLAKRLSFAPNPDRSRDSESRHRPPARATASVLIANSATTASIASPSSIS